MNNETTKFKAIIDKEIKSSDNFKIYAVTPTAEISTLKFNKYGNVSISGDLPDLTLGFEYEIEGNEGKWGYEITKIKRNKPSTKKDTVKFLTEVITNRQANSLLEAYPNIVKKVIDNDLKDINLSKVKYVKEATFEVIKRKIIENFPLMDFIEEYSKYNISLSLARKMYKRFTSIEIMRKRMNENPYETLCTISGISFKKADSIILSIEENQKLKRSINRVDACIRFCLNENESNGNTWISLEDLLTKCNELVPDSMEYFLDALSNNKSIYIDKENRRISNITCYSTEMYISKKLKELISNPRKLLIDYSKYNRVDGFELSEEQKLVPKNFCNSNISLLVGNAGSGKSFCTQAIINLCDDNDISYILMTPTGKSAIVLSEYTSRDAGTIHRKLEFNPSNENPWTYNEDNKLDVDVVIVDENGMTDIFLMKHLLEAIDTSKTRILFVQDDAQLPSVSCGNCAYDMINSNVIPITKLTKVFRYGEGGLLQIATKIRNGDKYVDNSCDDITTFGSKGDYSLIPIEDNSMADFVVDTYKRLLSEGNSPLDIMILSSKNVHENGTIELNKIIQKEINPYKDGDRYSKYGDKIFRENDIVIQNKNNYKAITLESEQTTITNGEIGKILKINFDNIHVQFQRDVIVYAKEELDQLDLAYCISIHKSQGSGVKNVILITPKSHKWNLNRNLMYVGVTRAKERCFHFSTPDTINFALNKSIELERNTFLLEMLKTKNN